MPKDSNYRVLALLWLAFAALNAAYGHLYYANTMIEVGRPTGSVGAMLVIGISSWASIISFFAIIMMLVYGRAPKLGRTALGWLHLIGTCAAVLMAWNVVSLALSFGVPMRYYSGSEEGARALVQQRYDLILWQFRGAVFLFVVSQVLFLIILIRKGGQDDSLLEDQMLDEVQ